jgi:hypothetical protein
VNRREVTVTAGNEAAVAFTITCTSVGATHWTVMEYPPDFAPGTIWASSSSGLIVLGSYFRQQGARVRAVLHYDGPGWTELLPRPPAEALISEIWGGSPTDIVAAGQEVWHYDGSQWVGRPTGVVQPTYEAIWGTSPQDVFAGGVDDASTRGAGAIDHYDGTAWTNLERLADQGTNVWDIAGTSPTDVYAVATRPADSDTPEELYYFQSQVLHYDGTTWSLAFSITDYVGPGDDFYLEDVWPVRKDDVFVVGSGGKIFHFDGAGWSPMSSPTTQTIRDVWGNASSNVYAVGDGGILHYDGTTWTVINGTRAIKVMGSGSDVFVVTEGREILQGTP